MVAQVALTFVLYNQAGIEIISIGWWSCSACPW